MPRRIIGSLVICAALGCRAAGPTSDEGAAAQRAADERVAALGQRVSTLERTVDSQARQLRCADARGAMRAAWYEHDHAAVVLSSEPCEQRGDICALTGLPPGTFLKYRVLVSEMVGVADAPYDVVRERMEQAPKMPRSTVESESDTRLRATRADAERATEGFLAACGATAS